MNRYITACLRKSFAALCATAAVFILPGCSDEPSSTTQAPAEETPAEDTPALYDIPEYTVAAVRQYDKKGLAAHVTGSYGELLGSSSLQSLNALLGFMDTAGRTFNEAVIEYTSVDHLGQPIRLSGIVCYPTEADGTTLIECLIVSSHPTITDNASCPSSGGDVAELLTLTSQTAVVSADYQGYGTSRSSLHPYLNEQLTARQQVDLAKAAVHYLCHGAPAATIRPQSSAYSVGYSQGGAVALAVHRRLESDERVFGDAIGFKGSVCGDGPYNLAKTLDAYISQGFVSIPAVLPMMVRAMMECYPDIFKGLALTDFFTEDFLDAGGGIVGLLDAKELNVMQYNALLGAPNPPEAKFPLSAILNPQALSTGSPQMKALNAAAALNNCIIGWIPSHPVGFFHSKADTVVPYVNISDAPAEWPGEAYTVSHPYTDDADHLACALIFYARLLSQGPAKML